MAVQNKYGGLKKLQYSTQATTGWVDLGEIVADSAGYKAETKTEDTASGGALYAGVQGSFEAKVYDLSTFSTLYTMMRSDTKIYLRMITMGDNYVDDTTSSDWTYIFSIDNTAANNMPVNFTVAKNYGIKTGSRNNYTLSAKTYMV